MMKIWLEMPLKNQCDENIYLVEDWVVQVRTDSSPTEVDEVWSTQRRTKACGKDLQIWAVYILHITCRMMCAGHSGRDLKAWTEHAPHTINSGTRLVLGYVCRGKFFGKQYYCLYIVVSFESFPTLKCTFFFLIRRILICRKSSRRPLLFTHPIVI